MEPENYKHILKKVLKDEYTQEERGKLSEEEIISSYLSEQWSAIPTEVDDKRAGKRIWKSIVDKCWSKSIPVHKRRLQILRYGAVAASLFLVGVLSFWLLQGNANLYLTASTDKGETLSIILPDSSTVWLNAETTIKYPRKFNEDRKVVLDGEAYFDVKHRSSAPFTVHFLNAVVEVKGTTFNIKTYLHSPAEVTLISGKIDFAINDSSDKITLNPSEQVLYNSDTHEIIRKKASFDNFDWRTGIYRFEDKRLDELLEVMKRIYNVNIVVEQEAYNSYLFTGTIKREQPLFGVIENLCISLDLKQRKVGDTIVLYR